jgi:hypothetical protein
MCSGQTRIPSPNLGLPVVAPRRNSVTRVFRRAHNSAKEHSKNGRYEGRLEKGHVILKLPRWVELPFDVGFIVGFFGGGPDPARPALTGWDRQAARQCGSAARFCNVAAHDIVRIHYE